MRPLKSHFPEHALPTLEPILKQTQEARVFRRAQAVREVVAGHHVHPVSATFHLANAARRQWVQRFAPEGPQGLRARPRAGRPPKVTCALEQHLKRLVEQDPLEPGSRHSPWSGRALATALARETGVPLGRESGRGVVKKRLEAPIVPPGVLIPIPQTSRLAPAHSLPWSIAHAGVRSLCSMQPQRCSGAVPCPARAGGAPPNAGASPPAPCVRGRANVRSP
jgi:transposase